MPFAWRPLWRWILSLKRWQKIAAAGIVLLLLLVAAIEEEPSVAPKQVSSPATQSVAEPVTNRLPENEAPELISFRIVPETPLAGDRLTAEVEVVDGEEDYTYLDYQWKRNGEVIMGEFGPLLSTEGFHKGDQIELTVIPSDGQASGESSSKIVVLGNHRPLITSQPSQVDGDRFTYQVVADDRDGDTLDFSLKEAPEGMSIDPKTGVVSWPLPQDRKEIFKVFVVVSDGEATTSQDFTIQFN